MSDIGTTNLPTREHWLKKALGRIPKGSKILDAGAGECQYKRFCKHLDYVSQDFGKYDGTGDSKGLQRKEWDQANIDFVCDIANIPAETNWFDAVMCIEVLEHLPHPVEALKELGRVLKSGGVLIITAPFCSLTHYAPYFFQTGYSQYFYEFWLQRLGFVITEITWNGNFFEYMAQEIRRIPSVAKKYTDVEMSKAEEVGLHLLLKALERMSKGDRGSKEFLAFGLHIMAVKQ